MATTTTIATQGHYGTAPTRLVSIATQGHFLRLQPQDIVIRFREKGSQYGFRDKGGKYRFRHISR